MMKFGRLRVTQELLRNTKYGSEWQRMTPNWHWMTVSCSICVANVCCESFYNLQFAHEFRSKIRTKCIFGDVSNYLRTTLTLSFSRMIQCLPVDLLHFPLRALSDNQSMYFIKLNYGTFILLTLLLEIFLISHLIRWCRSQEHK